ncbi:MAG: serine/threonine protein kinase [Gemmataceae bacterium]|nr:serine/threonine protein kinase [Gemmataceae bacterium]
MRLQHQQKQSAQVEIRTPADLEEEITFSDEIHQAHTKLRRKTFGPYVIKHLLGEGGMGRVFLAEHQEIKRLVAIKFLHEQSAHDPEAVKRFYQEAQTTAALNHPNIVRIFDINVEEQTHYLIMEYVPGVNLQNYLEEHYSLEVPQACNIALAVGQGLLHAHSKGVIHRDIKPSNVMLGTNGEIKILDMGLACFTQEVKQEGASQSSCGEILCTPDYAAPELITQPKSVDHRADIYSLGGMIYRMLSGHAPFQGSVTQKILAHQEETAAPVSLCNPSIPRTLCQLIHQMMAKSPNDRPQGMNEVLQRLEPYCSYPNSETSTSLFGRKKLAPQNFFRWFRDRFKRK